MKATVITLAVLIIAFFAIKSTQTPSVSSVKVSTPQVAHKEDMTQFSSDLAKFMKASAVKEGAPADMLDISATCKPDQGAYGTRCWINIKELATGSSDKATAENVRRRGDKFVWDHES